MKNATVEELLQGLLFNADVQETEKPATLPFYIRGNSGRLWEVYELLPTDTDQKALWKGKARSIGNEPQIEDELYVYQLITLYGLYDKMGNQLSDGEYASPQEMFNNAGTSYDEVLKDDLHYAANKAVKADVPSTNTEH